MNKIKLCQLFEQNKYVIFENGNTAYMIVHHGPCNKF